MPISLINLVDNLSEINKEECKVYMNGENIKSECDFIGHKKKKICFKCKKCKRILLKPSLSSIANSISETNKKRMQSMNEKNNYQIRM